jgi:class 3 adenylate cyclase
MRCPNCNSENPDATKFCGNCGRPLSNRCAKCGAENPPQFKFCGECGSPLQGASSPALVRNVAEQSTSVASLLTERPSADSQETPEGERKTVTALFADIQGSTELMRDLDPEEARAIVDPALKIMIESVHRYDGYVVQSTGDGIFALFGAPAAYEDHPQRALYAALQMQDALRRHAEGLKAEGSPAIEARIGVNTGEVVMRTVQTGGRVEYAPVGHVTNLAARLQTLAPPGGIVMGRDTRVLVDGYFEIRDLGASEVKGISEPINVYEVTGLGPLQTHFQLSARRGLTRFVGREHELEQMRHALELASGGNGLLVAVVAEAGTGKSRLFGIRQEFRVWASG